MKAMKMLRALTGLTTLAAVSGCLLFAHQTAMASSVVDLAKASVPEVSALIAADLMVLGPVESVDHKSGSVEVLGQTIRLSGSEVALRSLRRSLLRLSTGVVVEVRGRLLATGEIEAASFTIGSRPNVSGAQPLIVRGVVRAIDRDSGKLSIGKLVVDYTGALHSLDALSIRTGSEFLATGIQPVATGSFIALSAAVRGITGSDVNGITGSDVNGITGSDVNGITGSDVTAIGGGLIY